MKNVIMAAVALTALGFASSADAASYRTRIVVNPYYGLTAEEAHDYRLEQMEHRQEMERESLRARQTAERRRIDPDDED